MLPTLIWVRQSRHCLTQKGRNLDLFAPQPYANSAMNTMWCCRLFPVHGKAVSPGCPAYPAQPNRLPKAKPSTEGGCGAESSPTLPSFSDDSVCRHISGAHAVGNSLSLHIWGRQNRPANATQTSMPRRLSLVWSRCRNFLKFIPFCWLIFLVALLWCGCSINFTALLFRTISFVGLS